VLQGVFFKKMIGRDAKAVFQAQNVVRGEKLVQVPATFIETGHLF